MNILYIGIPDAIIIDRIIEGINEKITLFITETRPFEEQVSTALEELELTDLEVTVITDNMIGALFQNHDIQKVVGQYVQNDKGIYLSFPGTHIAALAASEFNKDFFLIKAAHTEGQETKDFFGFPISVEGAENLGFRWDSIPDDLIKGVLE